LAAAPTFAIMALLTGVVGRDPAEMLCSAAHSSPLSGMAPMYLLMSAFHSSPWLKLMSGRRPTATGPDRAAAAMEELDDREQGANQGRTASSPTYVYGPLRTGQ
jgi:hypothetical protein